MAILLFGILVISVILGLSYIIALLADYLFGRYDNYGDYGSAGNPSSNFRSFAAFAMVRNDIAGLINLAENSNTDYRVLKKIYDLCSKNIEDNPVSPYWSVIYRLANNRFTPADILEKLSRVENNPAVLKALRGNPAARAANIANLS